MLLPVRYDRDVAVFRLEDVNLFGLPEIYGYDNYIVTSTYEDEVPFVLDYEDEQSRKKTPVHRYSRLDRFKVIVYQLLGERGDVPQEVLDMVSYWGYDNSPELVWNSVRMILKTYGWSRYYNMIPTILNRLGRKREKIEFWRVENIFEKFMAMSFKFNSIRFSLRKRIYFPNLRYIALRMFEENGIRFNFDIPKIRTKRKVKVMEEIYGLIV